MRDFRDFVALGLKPLRQEALVALLHYFYNYCEDTSRRRYFRGERTRYGGANALNDVTTHDFFRAGHVPAPFGSGAQWVATQTRRFLRPFDRYTFLLPLHHFGHRPPPSGRLTFSYHPHRLKGRHTRSAVRETFGSFLLLGRLRRPLLC